MPPRKIWDRHHVWHKRKDYIDGIEYEFREFHGFVIPCLKTTHALLHEKTSPPPKPTKEEMLSCLGYLALSEKRSQKDPLWALERAMQHFVFIGADRPDREPVAHEIRHNLAMQIGILSSGLYTGGVHNGKRKKR